MSAPSAAVVARVRQLADQEGEGGRPLSQRAIAASTGLSRYMVSQIIAAGRPADPGADQSAGGRPADPVADQAAEVVADQVADRFGHAPAGGRPADRDGEEPLLLPGAHPAVVAALRAVQALADADFTGHPPRAQVPYLEGALHALADQLADLPTDGPVDARWRAHQLRRTADRMRTLADQLGTVADQHDQHDRLAEEPADEPDGRSASR